MYYIFSKIPALNSEWVLVDLFSHLARTSSLDKYKIAFDNEDEWSQWATTNRGAFKSKEAADKWLRKFGDKGTQYFVLEMFQF